MNLILNRDTFQMPTDGWYQLAPLGEFPHAAAGVIQVVDEESCTAMASRFKADAAVANFAGLLVDFDHFSLDGERRTEAAGWIMGLEYRGQRDEGGDLKPEVGKTGEDSTTEATKNTKGDGLWANIRWSDIGEEAVKGGRYRFLSPVWARSDCVDLGPSTGSTGSPQAGSGQASRRVRPVRLLNAAVTNDPNLKGLCPLSNSGQKSEFRSQKSASGDRQDGQTGTQQAAPVDSCTSSGRAEGGPYFAPASGATKGENLRPESEKVKTRLNADGGGGPVDSGACNRQGCERGEVKENTMKKVIEKLVNHLGLPSDATEDVILEKLQGLPGLTAVTELQNSLKKAKDERDALKGDLQNSVKQAQADRDALQGKLKGAEDELVNRHLAEFEGVISDATKPFWAEQLLKNREAALSALADVARVKVESGKSKVEGESTPAVVEGTTRKPLHNRATARPVMPGIATGSTGSPQAGSGSSEGRAVKIRNRAHEIAKGEGVAFSTAFRRAEKEVCEE